MSSLTGKMNKNEKILYIRFQNILYLFFHKFQFLLKFKPHEKPIYKIIYIEWGH